MTRTATKSRPAPRWKRRKEARPAEILQAAFAEFVDRGFAAARLDDIARRAGVTKGTIFLYVANKDELFKALVREFVVPMIEHDERTVEAHEGGARELLERTLRARWARLFETEASGLPKLLFSEAGKFPDLARFYGEVVVERSHAVLRRILERGIARGEFRADLNVREAARLAVAPILLAAVWKHSFAKCAVGTVEPEAFFETHLQLFLDGLAARGKEVRNDA